MWCYCGRCPGRPEAFEIWMIGDIRDADVRFSFVYRVTGRAVKLLIVNCIV
jgi:hypothetical protein